MTPAKLGLLGIGLGALAAASAADAAMYSYYFPEAAYSVDEGATVQVPIYFQETIAEGETSLFAPGNGLAFASVLMSMSDENVAYSSFTADGAWDVANSQSHSAGLYDITLFSPVDAGVPGQVDDLDPNISRVLLGNLTFQAVAAAGNSSNATASMDPDIGIVAFDNTPLGEVTSADVTISIVPEPASFGAALLGTCVLLRRRR
jgi:hypothetical protein